MADATKLVAPEAPMAQHVMKSLGFGSFEGSRGAPAAITNRRGMRKYPGGLIL